MGFPSLNYRNKCLGNKRLEAWKGADKLSRRTEKVLGQGGRLDLAEQVGVAKIAYLVSPIDPFLGRNLRFGLGDERCLS